MLMNKETAKEVLDYTIEAETTSPLQSVAFYKMW